MAYRFYLTPLPAKDEVAVLTGDQAHHAANVMRFQVGQPLVLFDGTGGEASCTIQSISKKQLEARVDLVEHHPQPQDRMLAVAVALPKGDRQKFLVEKLVELGVNYLIPLQTIRGVAEPNQKARTRIERQIIEATKQCRRKWLMKLETGMSIGQVPDWMAEHSLTEVQRFYGDPYEGDSIGRVVSEGWNAYVILVGPEGGFTDDETEQAGRDGFQPIRIGSHVLRVETAAIAAAAILGPGSHT
jgi:16S rRNA (uracil1498-N3)-methyltransferase